MYKRQGRDEPIVGFADVRLTAFDVDANGDECPPPLILKPLTMAFISWACLLYTSDAADERSSVDLGGRRIIKKKTKQVQTRTAGQKQSQMAGTVTDTHHEHDTHAASTYSYRK